MPGTFSHSLMLPRAPVVHPGGQGDPQLPPVDDTRALAHAWMALWGRSGARSSPSPPAPGTPRTNAFDALMA